MGLYSIVLNFLLHQLVFVFGSAAGGEEELSCIDAADKVRGPGYCQSYLDRDPLLMDQYCRGQYRRTMEEMCRRTCGFCEEENPDIIRDISLAFRLLDYSDSASTVIDTLSEREDVVDDEGAAIMDKIEKINLMIRKYSLPVAPATLPATTTTKTTTRAPRTTTITAKTRGSRTTKSYLQNKKLSSMRKTSRIGEQEEGDSSCKDSIERYYGLGFCRKFKRDPRVFRRYCHGQADQPQAALDCAKTCGHCSLYDTTDSRISGTVRGKHSPGRSDGIKKRVKPQRGSRNRNPNRRKIVKQKNRGAVDCADRESICSRYSPLDLRKYCRGQKYRGWMKRNCAATCNLCRRPFGRKNSIVRRRRRRR